MRILSRIALVFVLLLGALIAVSNSEQVELRLWPFDHGAVMPLYLMIVALLLLGVLIGLILSWVAGRSQRKVSRERRRETERLTQEVAQLRTEAAARDRPQPAESGAGHHAGSSQVRALERQQGLVDPEGMDPARARS